MTCCFEDRLRYDAPSNGDWGICRLGMLTPESVELFVGPGACGRHGALGAIHNGYKNRLFFLCLEQSDIVEGYAQLIPGAVEEILKVLPRRPRVILLIFTCLDDLIGTDHEALGEELAERFTGIEFRSCHMNPISLDTKLPPMVSIQNNIYSFLEIKRPKDDGVNTIGNYMALPGTSELRSLLQKHGMGPLRHVSGYRRFDEYLEMASSRLNLVLSPLGLQAAERLKKGAEIPYLFLPVSYDLDEIGTQYEAVGGALGIPNIAGELRPARERAESAVREALAAVGDRPMVVDDSATALPFGLAAALLRYGFRVVHIEAQMCAPNDEKHREWIESHFPEVTHSQPQNDTAVRYDHMMPEALAVGAQAAYFARADHIVDLFCDLEMFGFDGICRLMDAMQAAVQVKTRLEDILDKMGLVV